MRTPTSLGVARAAGASLVTAAPGGVGQKDASMEVMETCKDATNYRLGNLGSSVCEDAQNAALCVLLVIR